jgi:FkbM family methyltransferase
MPTTLRETLRTVKRRAFGAATLENRLRALGATVTSTTGPGVARFAGLRVRYQDPLVFYMELKDIFHRRIYDFSPDGHAPRVLDCGSHIGMSILYTRQRHPDARVIGFEPDPAVVPLLEENLRRNGYDDVELVQAALATGDGPRGFVSDLDGSHLVDGGGATSQVRTVRLDEYLDGPADFLKLNIEGAELDVLRASAARLGAVRQLVIEYHGFPDRAQYLHELLALLDSAGFRYLVHDFDAETNPATKPPFRLEIESRFFLLVYARQIQ